MTKILVVLVMIAPTSVFSQPLIDLALKKTEELMMCGVGAFFIIATIPGAFLWSLSLTILFNKIGLEKILGNDTNINREEDIRLFSLLPRKIKGAIFLIVLFLRILMNTKKEG